MNREQQYDLLQQVPSTSAAEYMEYALHHLKPVAQAFCVLARIAPDVFFREKQRNLADDFLRLVEPFKTNINIEGTENIPQSGAFVLAGTHVISTFKFPCWNDTNADPFWHIEGIIKGLKQAGRKEDLRPVLIDDIYSPIYRLKKKIYRAYRLFPVRQNSFNSSLNEAQKALQDGDIIYIEPEGANSREMTRFKSGGLAYLASLGSPFIPVAYYEEVNDGRSTFIMRFGKRIEPPTEARDWLNTQRSPTLRVNQQAFADTIGSAVASMMPLQKRGWYREAIS